MEYGLLRCSNIDIPHTCKLTEVFLKHGLATSSSEKEIVKAIGERFEFHRDGFNVDSVDKHSKALDHLYKLYDIDPTPQRTIHDGVSPIKIHGDTWELQYNNLWDYLVPSKGAALTVQGEVIRIAGRITNEILSNGAGNWDKDFTKMCHALIKYVQTGTALDKEDVTKLSEILFDLDLLMTKVPFLQKLALKWVTKNTAPIVLNKPNYKR